MSLTIDDPETVAAIRRLAELTHRTPERAVQDAVKTVTAMASKREEGGETRQRRVPVDAAERARRRAVLEQIQAEFASWPKTGLVADKAFFDSLED